MKKTLVMTLIGDDRTGLVDKVAGLVAQHGGNWLESRMSHLAGKFAGILRIDVATDSAAGLKADLGAVDGLQVTVESSDPIDSESLGDPIMLEVCGQDRPGIVSHISKAIAAHGANVEELDTECVSAPMSGETLFKASVKVRLASGASLDDLQEEVEKIAEDLLVDVSFPE